MEKKRRKPSICDISKFRNDQKSFSLEFCSLKIRQFLDTAKIPCTDEVKNYANPVLHNFSIGVSSFTACTVSGCTKWAHGSGSRNSTAMNAHDHRSSTRPCNPGTFFSEAACIKEFTQGLWSNVWKFTHNRLFDSGRYSVTLLWCIRFIKKKKR